MKSPRAEQTARKYQGRIAEGYLAKREGQPKWIAEDRVLREMTAAWPDGSDVLDCPTGTGRFIPHWHERDFQALALDISEDMLGQARDMKERVGANRVTIGKADAFKLPLPDKDVDFTACIRLLNLISPADMQRVLRELQRVTKREIIFNLRVYRPGTQYKHWHPVEDVEYALADGWAIVENVHIHEDDFRMIRLACAG